MFLKHLYYGTGKGKTTAALGLALRASGSGMRVHIVQFLKGTDTGELHSLERLENVTVSRCDRNYGFSFKMTEKDKSEITSCHNSNLKAAAEMVNSCKVDMLILDEVVDAYNSNLIDRNAVISLISGEPKVEIVMTGHDPEQIFIDCADYVSEIKVVKHPFEKGISSRKGIEY
jgi:cob(I)alamin adenosyltransferase